METEDRSDQTAPAESTERSWPERGARVALVLAQNTRVLCEALRGEPGATSGAAALLAARAAAAAVEEATRLVVELARADGSTWQEIGEWLAVTRQAAQQRFAQVGGADGDGHADLALRAAQIVGQIDAGQWEAVTADWDEVMRRELSVERLREVWENVCASAGRLRSTGLAAVNRRGPYLIVDVPLIFEHGPMKARVVFNHAQRISGLFLLLPDAP